jgi:tetraacyldisaccharide 4'-kinase
VPVPDAPRTKSPSLADRIWYGHDAVAAAGRALLTPAAQVFSSVVSARELLYDSGWLRSRPTAIPAISVGNVTVGGTGKTPIAAWIARGLLARGAKPAVVLRGYGEDEPLVHRTLNPAIPVVVGADRVAAIAEAAEQGADIAVLDDAFQHRRARRVADLVLISADQWTPIRRLLPAGPWREPLSAVRRATLVIVTRKAAGQDVVDAVNEAVAAVAPGVPRVSITLGLGELVGVTGDHASRTLDSLSGHSGRAILSIADPGAFIRQLSERGLHVRASIFPDHFRFDSHIVARLAEEMTGAEFVVCTLKDAVKLAPHWPRLAPPLWYVSQQVLVERGVGGIERVLDDLVRARSKTVSNAG